MTAKSLWCIFMMELYQIHQDLNRWCKLSDDGVRNAETCSSK